MERLENAGSQMNALLNNGQVITFVALVGLLLIEAGLQFTGLARPNASSQDAEVD